MPSWMLNRMTAHTLYAAVLPFASLPTVVETVSMGLVVVIAFAVFLATLAYRPRRSFSNQVPASRRSRLRVIGRDGQRTAVSAGLFPSSSSSPRGDV